MDLTSKQIEELIRRHFLAAGFSEQEEFQVLRYLMREYEYLLCCDAMAQQARETGQCRQQGGETAAQGQPEPASETTARNGVEATEGGSFYVG